MRGISVFVSMSFLNPLEINGAVETTTCRAKTQCQTLDDGFAAQKCSIN